MPDEDARADAEAHEPSALAGSAAGTEPAKPGKPSKADRLEAKAAKLRAAQDAAEQRAQERAAAPRGGHRLRWALASLTVLALLLAGALTWLAVQLGERNSRVDGLEASAALRASALKAAQSYAVDFGSYDYQHLDADFAKVSSHLTPEFAKRYQQVSKDLRSVIEQYKGRSTATVQGAGVSSVDGDTVVVVLFLDQKVTTTQSATSRIDRNRMQMTMQHQPDGGWRISDVVLK
jgi:Mce-associated membrane protein